MISFVFYFSSKRLDNLHQTLRFLKNRENLDKNEVILVCNDEINSNFSIPNYRIINLNLQSYNKPKMCNVGVSEASNEIVALLDSDRILPENYFKNNAKKLNSKEFISTTNLIKLIKDYSDEEIEQNKFEYFEDTKSKKGEILKKNLFSGNTLFFKQDYLDCGGMDESFVGYGFADNDMTLNVISKGYRAIWLKDLEVHLHHNIEFLYENKIINEEIEFKKVSRANLNKFIEKWNYKNISNFIKIR
jgi:hypothetical protein